MNARFAVSLVACGLLASISACGSSLSGSSTCEDYMNASQEQQVRVANKLATEYGKPSYATPLGFPEIAFECAQQPDLTLDDFFNRAQG